MKLWTWQADDSTPTFGDIDPRRPGSYYDMFPKYRPAFERLWDRLGTDQILWCFVDEEEARKPWPHRSLWALDVPDDSILAVIDPGVWERILGSRTVPLHRREFCLVWKQEAIEKNLDSGKYEKQKLKEYHETSPPGGDWWLNLFLDGPSDLGLSSKWVSGILGYTKTVSQVLLKRPVPESCVVSVR